MTPGRRQFLEDFIARIEPRAAARRRSGTSLDLAIAGALERIVARDRAELAAAPPAPAAISDPDRITWKSPVFNVGGRFNPFAGSCAEQMLASADACDRLGHPEIGDGYRELAARTATRTAVRAPPCRAIRHRRTMTSDNPDILGRARPGRARTCRRPSRWHSSQASRWGLRCD